MKQWETVYLAMLFWCGGRKTLPRKRYGGPQFKDMNCMCDKMLGNPIILAWLYFCKDTNRKI